MTAEKGRGCPRRPGTKAADRWHQAEERRIEAEKRKAKEEADKKEAEVLVSSAKNESRRPPSNFGDWGVVRTRAWAAVAASLSSLTSRERPNIPVIREKLKTLRDISGGQMCDSECQRLLVNK